MSYNYSIYFTERAKHRVLRWDPDHGGASVVAGDRATGPEPDQQLSDPYGLAFDHGGRLLIADKMAARIVRVDGRLDRVATSDVDGHRSAAFPHVRHHPLTPTSIWVEPSGALLVTFCDDFTIYRVHRDGRLELVLGLPPVRPQVIAVGASESVPAREVRERPLWFPTAVTSGPDQTIYFIERGFQLVRSYKPGGEIVSVFPMSARPSDPNASVPDVVSCLEHCPLFPTSLLVDRKGRLHIADAQQRCIWRVEGGTARRIIRTAAGPHEGGPAAMAFGPDQVLWVLDYAVKGIEGYREDSAGNWSKVASSYSECALRRPFECIGLEGAGLACA